jgi:glutamate racemase
LLATPATVRRPYTDDLIARYAADKRVVRFGSAALVEAAERKLRGKPIETAAVEEAITGLFSEDDIDVVALACTHFPLLKEELERAAPRSCTWLDSGAAIARRVAEITAAESGQPRTICAAFTDAEAARSVFPAFHARGFSSFFSIGAAPSYDVTPSI